MENDLPAHSKPALAWNAQEPVLTLGVLEVRLRHDKIPLPENTTWVAEEDTWQILSDDNFVDDQQEQHPVRVMTALIDQQPALPGEVIIRGNRWYAINYDLDQVPICQPKWIKQSTQATLEKAIKQNVSDLCMPLPGLAHGPISPEDSIHIIVDAIKNCSPDTHLVLWIRVSPEQIHEAHRILKEYAA